MPDEPKRLNGRRIIFERRKFVRIDGSYAVYYTDITTQEPKSDAGQAKNISAGGILFITDREFPEGTVLKLRIRLPDEQDYISVKVRVVYSRQRVKGLLYDTRAKFIGIREEHRDAIRKIVEYNLQKRKES